MHRFLSIYLQLHHPNLYQDIEHFHHPRKIFHTCFPPIPLSFKGYCFAFYIYRLVLDVLELLFLPHLYWIYSCHCTDLKFILFYGSVLF